MTRNSDVTILLFKSDEILKMGRPLTREADFSEVLPWIPRKAEGL